MLRKLLGGLTFAQPKIFPPRQAESLAHHARGELREGLVLGPRSRQPPYVGHGNLARPVSAPPSSKANLPPSHASTRRLAPTDLPFESISQRGRGVLRLPPAPPDLRSTPPSGAMNPYADNRYADPSSYRDRRRYVALKLNPSSRPSFRDPIRSDTSSLGLFVHAATWQRLL